MVSIGMKLNKAKSQFFDRAKVQNAISRRERKVLSRFGAFVRSDAKASIRRRKRPSKPGQGPTNQTGRLKKNIFFVYSHSRRSVIIGPTLLNGSTNAPEILEQGGVTTVHSVRTVRQRNGKRKQIRVTKRVQIEPRPYMGPAFEKNKDQKLPGLWQDAVIGAA